VAKLSQERFQETEATVLFCYLVSPCLLPLPHKNDFLFGKEENREGVGKNLYKIRHP